MQRFGAAPATVGLCTESLAGCGALRGEKYALGCTAAAALLCWLVGASGVVSISPRGSASRRRSDADCVISHCRAEKDAGTCSCRRTTPDGPRLLLWCSTSATARCRLATASGSVACTAWRWGPGLGQDIAGRWRSDLGTGRTCAGRRMVRLTAAAADAVPWRVGVGPLWCGALRVARPDGVALLVTCRNASAAPVPLVLSTTSSAVTENVLSEGYTRGGQECKAGRGAAGEVRCLGTLPRARSRLPLASAAAPGDLLAIITI